MSADRPWIVYVEYDQPSWRIPTRWGMGRWVRETAKIWFGHAYSGVGMTGGREYPERRRQLDLIVGRFATREEAVQAIRDAIDVQRETDARRDAVKAEMATAMEPFKSRILQINAEVEDRLRERMKGPKP